MTARPMTRPCDRRRHVRTAAFVTGRLTCVPQRRVDSGTQRQTLTQVGGVPVAPLPVLLDALGDGHPQVGDGAFTDRSAVAPTSCRGSSSQLLRTVRLRRLGAFRDGRFEVP
jgi:hypothetical protein